MFQIRSVNLSLFDTNRKSNGLDAAERSAKLVSSELPIRTAESLRNEVIKPAERSIKLASLLNTVQSIDVSRPIILDGYCRIHCFSELQKSNWIIDPLPTIPASRKLRCEPEKVRDARVLQLAACNLRCWYCFVDYASLSPFSSSAKYFEVAEIVSNLFKNSNGPLVLDLSGGNPGLTPEWILWTIMALKEQNIENAYVWADDNLTANFYSRYLTTKEMTKITEYPRFGSVGCFKGFDAISFSFNTGLPEDFFIEQFNVFRGLLSYGWDIYGYVTFTTHSTRDLSKRITRFIDSLQEIDENLPLRVIPLEIKRYTPTMNRMTALHENSMNIQYEVLACWNEQVKSRFSTNLLSYQICDIPYKSRKV